MSFQDKSLQCSDCGTTFTFSAGEQEFFQSKGFTNEPKRCPLCRRANKARLLAVETTATIPSGEYFVPSTPGVGKTRKYRLSLVKAGWCIVVVTTVRSE